MIPMQIRGIAQAEFSRCEEIRQMPDHGKSLSPLQKTDMVIKGLVDRAIWKDDVLRAIEYDEIDVRVKNAVVYLHGHIVSAISKSRIENALRSIPGILRIQNDLVADDKLTNDVAKSLGKLEHIYDCKFFTGASHGVVSINGNVRDENVKMLAEKYASSNPNVRAVINNVCVAGARAAVRGQPFLQPTIGEIIYFLDGVSGVVRQVIINPNNRRVIAMILEGIFADQRHDLNLLADGKARHLEQLVAVPMYEVRYLTKTSGFLDLNSHERNRYIAYHPTDFSTPPIDWQAPYPYCPDDVLFPIEPPQVEHQMIKQLPGPPLAVALQEQELWEQLLADDSLGGS